MLSLTQIFNLNWNYTLRYGHMLHLNITVEENNKGMRMSSALNIWISVPSVSEHKCVEYIQAKVSHDQYLGASIYFKLSNSFCFASVYFYLS